MRLTHHLMAWFVAGVGMATALGVLVFLLIALPGCYNHEPPARSQAGTETATPAAKAGSDQSMRVKVVRPTREHLKRLSTPQPAQVSGFEKTDIYAKVPGYVATYGQIKGADGMMRPVDIGDFVSKDQVLATLSVPEMEQEQVQKTALVEQAEAEIAQAAASLTAAQAMVDAAKAKLNEARANIERSDAELAFRKVEFERYVMLVKERATRQELADEKSNQYRAAEAALKAAKASLESGQANVIVEQAKLAKAKADTVSAEARCKVSQANLKQAAIMLSYATIKAPYDGIVTRRLLDTGAFVQSATTGKAEPLFTMVRLDRLRIIAEIPEAEAGLVKIGQAATLQLNAARGQTLLGKVARFADALDSGTRMMRTEVELEAPPKNLRSGMFGSVTIVLADVPDALMLPAGTLVGGAKPAVMVVEAGKARRQEVELGVTDGGRVHVIRGLTGKAAVIADGKIALRDGQAVELAP